MSPIADLLLNGKTVAAHRPWPRVVVTADVWQNLANELAGGDATLLGLWGDGDPVSAMHMAIMSEAGGIAVASIECPDGRFPSVGAVHPPAIRLERAVFSLYGFEPVGAPDLRPWLDLGFWDVQHPMGAHKPRHVTPTGYTFLPVE